MNRQEQINEMAKEVAAYSGATNSASAGGWNHWEAS